MEKLKRYKGITLISLIITIIILIILAGISISLLLGDEGLLNKAKYATESYSNAQQQEELEIAKYSNDINSYVSGNREIENFELQTGNNYIIKKYDNGIIELMGNTGEISVTTRNPWTSPMYLTDEQTLNFPIEFKSIISINLGTISSNATTAFISSYSASNKQIKYQIMRPNNDTFNINIHYNIVGYWK